MFTTNRLFYSCLVALVSAYCTLEITFLTIYTQQEITEHVFYIKGELYNNGENVVMINILNLIGMFALLLIFIFMECERDTKSNCEAYCNRCGGILLLSIVAGAPGFALVMSIAKFAVNCSYGTPSCYEVHTPLYGMVLFNLHLLFLAIVACIVFCIAEPFLRVCNKPQQILQQTDYESLSLTPTKIEF